MPTICFTSLSLLLTAHNQAWPIDVSVCPRFESEVFLFSQCQFLGVGSHEALASVSVHWVLNRQVLYGTHFLQLVGCLGKPAAGVDFIWSSVGGELFPLCSRE